MNILYAFGITAVYFIACLGMGNVLLLIFKPTQKAFASPLTNLAITFLLGQGILANLWVFMALAGRFSPLLVKSLVLILCIVGLWFNSKFLFQVKNQFVKIWQEVAKESTDWKFLIGATVLICLMWLPFWFPLETSGSRYYMAIAKVTSASEHLKVLPGYEEVASLGMQGEMQFAALMTLGSPESTQFFSWVTFITGCILLLALGRQVGLKRHGQWLTLAIVFTSSAVIGLSGGGKTDLYGAAFAFAACYCAFRLDEENWKQLAVLIGLFSGMAVMAKLNYAVNFLPSLALILMWKILMQPGQKNFQTKMIPFLMMGLGGGFIALQMPIKNQILFGDPLAAFHSAEISSQVWYGAETIRRIYILLPFSLTFGGFWGQGGGISPLILAFLPILFFIPKPAHWFNSPLFVLSVATVLGLTCWFLAYPSNFALRYFLASALLLSLPAAKAAEVFATHENSNWRFIQIPVLGIIFYMMLVYIGYPLSTNGSFRQVWTGEANCNNEPMRCLITENANQELPYGARIFTYTRYRYWLRPDLIQCASTTEEINNFASLDSAELRWKYLIGRGFNAVMIENRSTVIPSIMREILGNTPDWLSVDTSQSNKNIFYFQIKSNQQDISSLYQCSQTITPAWDISEIVKP